MMSSNNYGRTNPILTYRSKTIVRLRVFQALTFGRFRGERGIEVEGLVRDDGGLEGRRDGLLAQLGPVDGAEERVVLQFVDAVGACMRKESN